MTAFAQAASGLPEVVLVAQAGHALGAAEPVERVVGQQPGDDLLTRGADGGGTRTGAHTERDFLRRVDTEVGLLAAHLPRVSPGQLPMGN